MKPKRCEHKKSYGPECCAEEGHEGPHLFKCVSEHQPVLYNVAPHGWKEKAKEL